MIRCVTLLCACAVVSSSACSWRERSRLAEEELASLGREIGVAFPPGSKLLGIKRYAGMDDAVRAKIGVPRERWPAMEKVLPIPASERVPGAAGLGPDRDWWDPATRSGLRTGSKHRGGGRFMRIGVDESQAEMVVLYVVEHGT